MQLFVDNKTFVDYEILPFALVSEDDLTIKVLEQRNPVLGAYFHYVVAGKPETTMDFRREIIRTYGEGRVSEEDTFEFVNLGRPVEVSNMLSGYPEGSFFVDFMGILTENKKLVIDRKENLEEWIKEGDVVLEMLPCDGEMRTRNTDIRVVTLDAKGKANFRYAQDHEVFMAVPTEYVLGTKVVISSGVSIEFLSNMLRAETRTDINKKLRDKYKMGKEHMKIQHFPLPIKYCNRTMEQVSFKDDRCHVIFDPKDKNVQIRTLDELSPDYEDFFGNRLPTFTKGAKLLNIRNF